MRIVWSFWGLIGPLTLVIFGHLFLLFFLILRLKTHKRNFNVRGSRYSSVSSLFLFFSSSDFLSFLLHFIRMVQERVVRMRSNEPWSSDIIPTFLQMMVLTVLHLVSLVSLMLRRGQLSLSQHWNELMGVGRRRVVVSILTFFHHGEVVATVVPSWLLVYLDRISWIFHVMGLSHVSTFSRFSGISFSFHSEPLLLVSHRNARRESVFIFN